MLGIFANAFKRATYQEDSRPDSALRADERPPFHWSYETCRRMGWKADADE